MDKIGDNLERHYKFFIDQTDRLGFFNGLADYVNYVLETLELSAIGGELTKKRDTVYEKLAQLEEETLQELKVSKNKLLKIIKENKISPDSLHGRFSSLPINSSIGLLEELRLFEEGEKIQISGFKSDSLERYLSDIAVGIKEQGHLDLLSEFSESEEASKYPKNIYGNFIFSKTLSLRQRQLEMINNLEKLEIWGCFNHLLVFQKGFTEACKDTNYTEVLNKYVNLNRLWFTDNVYITFATEDMKKILKNKSHGLPLQDKDLQYLEIPKFRQFTTRTHLHLLTELSKKPDPTKTADGSVSMVKKLDFDIDKSSLFIGADEIKLKKFGDQYHLLRIIFRDRIELPKEWFFSEITELYDVAGNHYPDKKFYNAAYQINQKIKIGTSIKKDFFITTTQSVKIDPEFLR